METYVLGLFQSTEKSLFIFVVTMYLFNLVLVFCNIRILKFNSFTHLFIAGCFMYGTFSLRALDILHSPLLAFTVYMLTFFCSYKIRVWAIETIAWLDLLAGVDENIRKDKQDN